MEQHPVPQNVTTFQFRLIGDMTIKQFGYLIAGGILAVIAYKLPLPFIITWPLAGAFAFLGVGFAFIPVEERPMDVWVFSFFKSVYSPTQYIWSHDQTPENAATAATPDVIHTPTKPAPLTAATPAPAPQPVQVAQPQAAKAVLTGLFQPAQQVAPPPKPVAFTVPAKHTSFMDEVMGWLFPKPKAATAPVPPQAATPSVTGYRPPAPPTAAPVSAADTKANEAIHNKMTQLEDTLKTLEERLSTKTITEDRVLELQKQLTDVLSQKAKTEDELIALKRHLTTPPPQPSVPPQPTTVAQPQQKEAPLTPASRGAVNVITTQEGAVKAGLPRLTNVPNVITGLVKDDTGNFLPGILVTVTNSDGIPMRALKTNKLGQFAASTQLASGTYFVEVEDPRGRFTFSRVQITLNNAVVPILEIIAKSEKALTREKLAQEIFGKPNL